MKELSIEQKAKAYDKVREKIALRFGSNVKDEIFSEYEESKDERIRRCVKYAIDKLFLKEKIVCDVHKDDVLDWLEKQGEQKSAAKYKVGDTVYYDSFGRLVSFVIANIVEDGTDNPMYEDKNGNSIFQNDIVKQKPANKVESKFKAGDWVVCNNGSHPIFQVIERSWPNAKYRGIKGNEIFLNVKTLEKQYHLWTIQDAKDGDVLVSSSGKPFIFKGFFDNDPMAYGGLVADDSFWPASNSNWTTVNCKPATKEQRDLLFQKMKEAGYEWDAEKKELKKIEQKQVIDYSDSLPKDNWELIHEFVNKFGRIPKDEDELNILVEYVLKRQKPSDIRTIGYWHVEDVEQNPSWSEEDEKIQYALIALVERQTNYPTKWYFWLKSIKERVQPQPKQEWSEEDYNEIETIACHLDNIDNEGMAEILRNIRDKYYSQNKWKPSDEHYELEEFAKIVRSNLTGISKAVQELFEAKYLQLTGNKMYGGFKD